MTVRKLYEQPIKTYQGGVGYKLSLKEAVVNMLCTGLIGNTLYTTEADIIRDSKQVYEDAARKEPHFLAKAAVYARNECGMKLQPVLALVYLSVYSKGTFSIAFDQIVKNPKDLNDFVNLCRKAGIRQGLGRTVKAAINQWLNNNVNDYNACRYGGKLYEVLKVTHPMPCDNERAVYFAYISGKFPRFDRGVALGQVLACMKAGRVDDFVLHNIAAWSLQLEEIKHQFGTISDADRQAIFTVMIPRMSYMALVQNLATIERTFGCNIGTVETMVAMRVANYDLYKKSRMLPFKIISAREMVNSRVIQRALESILNQGSRFDVQNAEVYIDVSGSMEMYEITPSLEAADVSCIFGSMIAMSDDSNKVYSVSDKCVPIRRDTDELVTLAKKIHKSQPNSGTRFNTIAATHRPGNIALIITDNEQCDNLEIAWPVQDRLIVWQLTVTHTKISKRSNVIYVNGFNDNLVKAIARIMGGGISQVSEIEKVVL
jgi:hypothetical protein